MAQASKEEKNAAKAKAIKNGFDPVAAETVFKMKSPEVAYMAKVAGTPSMKMGYGDKVMKLEHEDKKDLVSGNTITMNSSGTGLNTNVQGANTSSSETVKKSGGSGKSYSEAYKNADKNKYSTLESFTKAAKAYNQSKSSSSSKPDVSTVKKTNVSIDNIAKPKISQQKADLTDRQFKNLNVKIQSISDSLSTDNLLRNKASLGKLTSQFKADQLSEITGKEVSPRGLGEFNDPETFINFVSGAAASKVIEKSDSDLKPTVNRPLVSGGNIYANVRGNYPKPGSEDIKAKTGFSTEDILKKSGEKTMQMANTYFNRKGNKK